MISLIDLDQFQDSTFLLFILNQLSNGSPPPSYTRKAPYRKSLHTTSHLFRGDYSSSHAFALNGRIHFDPLVFECAGGANTRGLAFRTKTLVSDSGRYKQ